MGCCTSTEVPADFPETAMAPSNWVLRRRARLHLQPGSADEPAVAADGAGDDEDFGFPTFHHDDDASQTRDPPSSPAPSARNSDFAWSLAPSAEEAQGTVSTAPASGACAGPPRTPTISSNPLKGSARVTAAPAGASDVVVGDALLTTSVRQPLTLPHTARVLRFSPVLRPTD